MIYGLRVQKPRDLVSGNIKTNVQKQIRTSTVLAGPFKLIKYKCEDTVGFYGRVYCEKVSGKVVM